MSYLPEVLPEYQLDFSQELSIEEFFKYGFYKIADAVLKPEERFIENPEVNPIQYLVVPGLEFKYNQYRELVYGLCVDYKIGKFGGTYVGMRGRHSSYNCGTRKARNKGTCSVTNFNITEVQYAAICAGKKVEWYVFDVPPAEEVVTPPWAKPVSYTTKTYYKYESTLCEKYKQLTGHFPLLSKNAGVE